MWCGILYRQIVCQKTFGHALSQGETRHLVSNVEGRTVLPALPHALSIGHHGGAILCDTLTAKGCLCQTTLADVHVSLTRQQAFSEDEFRPLQAPALGEMTLPGHQDIPNILRVVEQDRPLCSEAIGDDVAIVTRHTGIQTDGVAAKGKDLPPRPG